VKRHDWLIAVFEELAGALLCFNPAVWWLLAQTRLAREQLVDAEVVRLTEAREPYIDALLSTSRTGPVLDLAPAPLFLRKRHLTQRLYLLLKEVSMSKTRLLSSYGSIAAAVVLAGWFACATFPLIGRPQAAPKLASANASRLDTEPAGVLQGNHYHHNLTGVEFDLPPGWSIGRTRSVDGDPKEMTVLRDPAGKAIFASVAMTPLNLSADGIPNALARVIPQLLARRGGKGGVHAAPNYQIRESSLENTYIGGQQAVRAIGEYQQGGQKIAELLTWIITEHTGVYFFAKMAEADLESVRVPYEQMIDSARVP
jgi:hypothetical protein